MDLPVEIYRSYLCTETTAVAEGYRDPTEFVPGLYESDSPSNQDWILIRSTNVHMVPGITKPRLRKTDLPHPEIPAWAALEEEIVTACTGYLRGKRLDVPDAFADDLAVAVTETCATMDGQTGPLIAPFKTLGVLGMYATSERKPLVRCYMSTTFLLDVAARLSDDFVSNVELAGTELGKEVEDIRGGIAMASLATLLLPDELTHPKIQTALFE